MKLHKLPISGCFLIETQKHQDDRGLFYRQFCATEFSKLKLNSTFVQSNISCTSKKGTIRGLHTQCQPCSEVKVINCLKGKVFDVVVDLRPESVTYKKWCSILLESSKSEILYIPQGCAHGFQTLEENCILCYFHSQYYFKESELTLLYNDTELNISWPLGVTEISKKDLSGQRFKDVESRLK